MTFDGFAAAALRRASRSCFFWLFELLDQATACDDVGMLVGIATHQFVELACV